MTQMPASRILSSQYTSVAGLGELSCLTTPRGVARAASPFAEEYMLSRVGMDGGEQPGATEW